MGQPSKAMLVPVQAMSGACSCNSNKCCLHSFVSLRAFLFDVENVEYYGDSLMEPCQVPSQAANGACLHFLVLHLSQ